MKLHVACIGKLKTGPEKALADDYQKRITRLCRSAGLKGYTLHEGVESQRPTVSGRMTEEAAYLAQCTPPGSIVVALDGRGTSLTSENFADLIRKYADAGQTNLVFCIGGPDGHDPAFRNTARHTMALGTMTWPHRLVRIMLLEQIYRAITILTNHPYHRG